MVMVSVHQPNFMPWLKLMAKILDSDIYVAYDSVQFTRQEFHARQFFRNANGEAEWLTAPVVSTGSRQILSAVRLVTDKDWRTDHLDFLTRNYSSAAYFEDVFSLINDVYQRRHDLLVDHNLDLLQQFCNYIGSNVAVVRASELPHTGTREERLLDLVRHSGGDAHLTSTSATHVIDWSGFQEAGIPVYGQKFTHPVYPQGKEPFLPNLGVADLLFHTGTAAGGILKDCSQAELLTAQLQPRADQPPNSRPDNVGTAGAPPREPRASSV